VPLPRSKILVDDPVRSTGTFVTSNSEDDRLNAAFIMVDVTSTETDRIEGAIYKDPEDGGALLEVLTEDGTVCVDVPEEARVFLVTTDDGEGKGSVESIDRSDLMFRDRVNIYGVEGATIDDCFAATTVISFGVDASVGVRRLKGHLDLLGEA
jgi:hypothetical protein